MNKSKAKNIALGVSVGLNILMGLVFTLSMVKACNAPKTQESPVSSVSPRTLKEIPTLANNEPEKAVSTLQTGVQYVFGDTLTAYPTTSVVNAHVDYVLTSSQGDETYDYVTIAYKRLMFVLSTGSGATSPLMYNFASQAWELNSSTASTAPNITFSTLPDDATFVSWLKDNLTEVETPADSVPLGSYEVGEHIGLSADYDFRRWFGNVDPNVGLIGNSYDAVTSVVYGGLEWIAGDGLKYNAVSFVLQPLNASNTFIVNSDFTAKTAESIYGSDYDKYAMLNRIYYLYIPDYDGAPMYDATGTNYPSYDYRAIVYTSPLVAGTLDGSNQPVSAFDLRGFAIDKIYRSFDVVSDGGNRFDTIAYNNVTLTTMLKNNFSTIVSFGDVTTNPFTLLSSAFSSVGNILSIAILPNLTLGTLIFIPLVVTIILVIVKLLQK